MIMSRLATMCMASWSPCECVLEREVRPLTRLGRFVSKILRENPLGPKNVL